MESNLNKASSFSFQLTLPVVPLQRDLTASEDLILNIFDSVVPGVALNMVEQAWQGGKIQMMSGKLDFNPWNVSFVVDEDFNNWKLLYDWICYINNNKDKYAERNPKYTVDATLTILNNFKSSIFSLKVINIWPLNLNDITLSFREGETNLECSVTFAYDRFEILKYNIS